MEKVLVAEDNPQVSALLKEYLKRNGFSVDIVEDGYSLISYMSSSSSPDIVVLDLILPGRNGSDLLCGIKSKWPNVKVFIFSGYPDYEVITQGYVDGFICKADGIDKLIETVKIKCC